MGTVRDPRSPEGTVASGKRPLVTQAFGGPVDDGKHGPSLVAVNGGRTLTLAAACRAASVCTRRRQRHTVEMEPQVETDISGQVAIVTGASRGIGRRTALMLAERGVQVVVAARTVHPRRTLPGTLGETVALIEGAGGTALAVPTDLSHEDDLKRLVDAAVDRFGGVDVLINNAAVTDKRGWSTPFVDVKREDWLYEFDVNLHAVFTLSQLVVPIMEQRGGGRILNVTTVSAEAYRQAEETPRTVDDAGLTLAAVGYFSSKRAMDRLATIVAPQLAPKNIYMITVFPGWAASEIALIRVNATDGLPPGMVPLEVPARLLTYFAACKDPNEYTGRIFWAERDLPALGIETHA